MFDIITIYKRVITLLSVFLAGYMAYYTTQDMLRSKPYIRVLKFSNCLAIDLGFAQACGQRHLQILTSITDAFIGHVDMYLKTDVHLSCV